MILVTAHRRENLGKPLEQICEAIKEIVDSYSDIEVVYPVHLNPKVRETVMKMLEKNPKIHLIDPIDVEDMNNLME